jgi:hypothetical protein
MAALVPDKYCSKCGKHYVLHKKYRKIFELNTSNGRPIILNYYEFGCPNGKGFWNWEILGHDAYQSYISSENLEGSGMTLQDIFCCKTPNKIINE